MTVEEAVDAEAHADEMMRRAESNAGIDGLDCVSDFDRAIRRCPPHFTWQQRLFAHRIMLRAYMRAVGRA